MVKLDYYTCVGFALELLDQSPYHRDLPVVDYLSIEILPPLHARQFKFYFDNENKPTAFVTWAWINKEVEDALHLSGRALSEDEWCIGDRLFFNDWVTPFGNIRAVARDMTDHVFPDHEATSVRRDAEGNVRKICRWTGANFRRPLSLQRAAS